MGRPALLQGLQLLDRNLGKAAATPLACGSHWRHGHLLLAASATSVRFLGGNALFEEDLEGFLRSGDAAPSEMRRPVWLAALAPAEIPFWITLASTLAIAFATDAAGFSFLDRFGYFFVGNRPELHLAERDLRHVLDGLTALERAPALCGVLRAALGESTMAHIPKGVGARDIARFLGVLLTGDERQLSGLPGAVTELRASPEGEVAESLRDPYRRRRIEDLERAAIRLEPVLIKLRSSAAAALA